MNRGASLASSGDQTRGRHDVPSCSDGRRSWTAYNESTHIARGVDHFTSGLGNLPNGFRAFSRRLNWIRHIRLPSDAPFYRAKRSAILARRLDRSRKQRHPANPFAAARCCLTARAIARPACSRFSSARSELVELRPQALESLVAAPASENQAENARTTRSGRGELFGSSNSARSFHLHITQVTQQCFYEIVPAIAEAAVCRQGPSSQLTYAYRLFREGASERRRGGRWSAGRSDRQNRRHP